MEQEKELYEIAKQTFSECLTYLDCEEVPLDKNTIGGVLLELKDRKDLAVSLTLQEKNALFLVEFYEKFLDEIYPEMEVIISKNTYDTILEAKLIPEVNQLTNKFNTLLETTLSKYNLTIEMLNENDPFLKSLTEFKMLFMVKLRPYPDFDYNIENWKNRVGRIIYKIRMTRLYLITNLGNDWENYVNYFKANELKNKIEKLLPIYEKIIEKEEKIR